MKKINEIKSYTFESHTHMCMPTISVIISESRADHLVLCLLYTIHYVSTEIKHTRFANMGENKTVERENYLKDEKKKCTQPNGEKNNNINKIVMTAKVVMAVAACFLRFCCFSLLNFNSLAYQYIRLLISIGIANMIAIEFDFRI